MSWMHAIWRFFSAPVFADDMAETIRVRLLNTILNVCLVGLVLVTLGNLVGRNVPTTIYGLNMAGVVLLLGLRFWLNRNNGKLIGIVTLGIFFVYLTIINVTLGTIRTPTASAYLLLVAMGGILFGQWGMAATVASGSLAILGLIGAQNAGLLPTPDLTVGVTQWISYTVFLVTAGTLTNYALHSIQQALNNANQELVLRRQVEATLRERESFLQAITNNVQEMLFLVALDGTVQYASPSSQRWLGYKPEELVGRSGFDLMHPDDAQLLLARLHTALQEGRTASLMTFRSRHADGRYIFLEASAQFVNDAAGISGVVTVFRDVTTQRQTEAQIRLLSRAVEDSPVSIVMADVTGSIIYVNPKFVEVTGYSFAEVRGHNPRILQSGQTPPETYAALWQAILAGQVWSGEFLNKHKDGRLYWESAVISPISEADGQISHFIAIKEDITHRKQMETQLHRRNDTLNALHTITLDILKRRTVADLLQTVVLRAVELLDAPYAELMLLERTS
ncbi:MAG: PAS domain S-box protein [Chloroflexi bacterium]|nr:PAS domain S-box protein [Chloroflexota bacterium]